MMRKKSYELIADVIHVEIDKVKEVPTGQYTGMRKIAVALADEFQRENQHFKRALFLLQSGVDG